MGNQIFTDDFFGSGGNPVGDSADATSPSVDEKPPLRKPKKKRKRQTKVETDELQFPTIGVEGVRDSMLLVMKAVASVLAAFYVILIVFICFTPLLQFLFQLAF